MQAFLRKLNRFFVQGTKSPGQLPLSEAAVDERTYEKYSFIIGSVIAYFNDLSSGNKRKFVNRVHHFRQLKKFHFIGLENTEDIAILVSASAVQITFGLKDYYLHSFKDIYILADAYHMDTDDELYIGHVAPDGIYLSWKHFLYGYAYRHDNVNVAVHEMAHALLHNNYLSHFQSDTHFRLNYEKFSSKTGKIFADVITRRQSYLRSYAFTNMHEFWAVSVEAFFENPDELRKNMPELFDALCRVLNQDPSLPDKLL